MGPGFGYTKQWKRTKEREKLKKITNNLRKHKLLKPLKSLAIIWKILILFQFLFILIQMKSYWKKLFHLGHILKSLGPVFSSNVLREKETQILTAHKTFMAKHIVRQTKHQLRRLNMVFFQSKELNGTFQWWELNNKLNQTENFE